LGYLIFGGWTARERTIEKGKVRLVLSRRQRTGPRPIGAGDVQTIDSAGWHGSGWPFADNSANTRSPADPCARPDYTDSDHCTGTVRWGALLPPENPGKPAAHFNYLLPSVYERDQHPEGQESLAPVREIRSLSLTQSSPPSLQYWEGRSRYDGTLHIQHVQLGPLPTGGPQDFVLAQQTFPGGPFSVAPYGVSLSYDFGRNAHMGHAAQIWRRLGRVVGATR
jgi:hypothetical protein